MFAKALENTGKEKANQLYNQAVKTLKTAPQFSIKSINGEKVVFIDTDQDIFDGADVKEYPKIAQKYMLNKFRGKVFPVGTSSAYVKLYVAITLNGIKKTEVLGQGNTKNGVTQYSRSVNISILDFMRLVNPSDTNFTKYFPEGIITEEQKEQLRFSRKKKSTPQAQSNSL